MLFARRPRDRVVSTPVLVLGAEKDATFPAFDVARTAAAFGVEAEIFPDMAHDMMLEPGWREVADRIMRWAAELSYPT